MRKRLSKAEAISLGFKPRESTVYGNARYTLTENQWNDLLEVREEFKEMSQISPKNVTRENNTGAKILIFDIETLPSLAFVWSKWKQNIHDEQLVHDWFMVTWSAKWLFEKEVHDAKLTKDEVLMQNDKRIVYSIWKKLDEADIVIGHNLIKFDLRKLNARFLLHGLGTPSSYQVIDTLVHSRKMFSIHSHKLNYLANILGVGSKVKHDGFELWERCYRGDIDSINEMSRYNNQDVKINEEVYLEIRPFIKPHPNLGLFINDDINRCPCCGSDDLIKTGEYYTTMNIYPEYKCNSCNSNSRGRKALKRGSGILSSLPR